MHKSIVQSYSFSYVILIDQLVNSTEASEETSAIETTLRRAAARRSLIYGSGKEFDIVCVLREFDFEDIVKILSFL